MGRNRKVISFIFIAVILIILAMQFREEKASQQHQPKLVIPVVEKGNIEQEPKESEEKPPVQYVADYMPDRFHIPNCTEAEKIYIQNMIVFYTREEAVEQGFEPCSICNP